eukprot:13304366-Heterocapsa_arctica.AAC.1
MMKKLGISESLSAEIEKQTRVILHQTDVMNNKLNTSFFVFVFLLMADEVAGTPKIHETVHRGHCRRSRGPGRSWTLATRGGEKS